MCKIYRSIALCMVKLQLFEVEELNVCGSLVLSNPVTYFLNYVLIIQIFFRYLPLAESEGLVKYSYFIVSSMPMHAVMFALYHYIFGLIGSWSTLTSLLLLKVVGVIPYKGSCRTRMRGIIMYNSFVVWPAGVFP